MAGESALEVQERLAKSKHVTKPVVGNGQPIIGGVKALQLNCAFALPIAAHKKNRCDSSNFGHHQISR